MTATEKSVSVMPFAVEARTPRNQDVMIQGIGNVKLRGAVSASVEMFDKQMAEDGEDLGVQPAGAKIHPGIGELPGEILYVNAAEGTWKTRDPLFGKQEKLDRIKTVLDREREVRTADRLRGIKPREGELGRAEMKSLCRELISLLDAREVKLVKGVRPTTEDVDALPGRYLLNQTNLSGFRQPRYEDEYEDWVDKMHGITKGG